jgi:hypothetical protein
MIPITPTWQTLVLVCTHSRPEGADRACCGAAGHDLRNWLKDRVRADGLKGVVLATQSGCQDVCSPRGVTVTLRGAGAASSMIVQGAADREALWLAVCDANGGKSVGE